MTKIAKLVARNVRPRFSHDCECCHFVGQLDGQDLYSCPLDGSFVRRFGHEGPQYGSLPADLLPPGSAYSLASKLVLRVDEGEAPAAWRTA